MNLRLIPLALLAFAPFVRADDAKPVAEETSKSGIVWTTDFEAAKAEAAKSGRDILVDFTGSDWCGWCIKLKKEVFDQAAFAPATKQFVFLELDFPNKKPQSDELKKQNKALAEKFSIQGYPTILLLDAQGVPYASTGYRDGGPEAYLKHLAELRADKTGLPKKIAAADALSGDAKAKALADIVRSMDPSIRKFHGDLMAKLAAADPDDKQAVKLEETIDELPGKARIAFGKTKDSAAAVKVFDDFIAAHPSVPVETRQKIDAERFSIFAFHLQKTISDKAELSKKLLAEVDRIVALAPATETAEQLKSYRPRIEAMGKAPAAK